MDTKQNAAGGKPAASTKKQNTLSGQRHNTTKFQRLDLDTLLSRIDLEQIAQQVGTKLHRGGGELRGICPLHKGDNLTAFTIYKDPSGHERWRCYTKSNAGGDAIDFVQRWHNLDFIGAVKYLAEYAHFNLQDLGFDADVVQLEAVNRKQSDVLVEAARYYAAMLAGQEGETSA